MMFLLSGIKIDSNISPQINGYESGGENKEDKIFFGLVIFEMFFFQSFSVAVDFLFMAIKKQ